MLKNLFEKYGSDKLIHGYSDFYEKHLPESPKRILEIGVKNGASLSAWAERFPESEIYGLDLFQENNIDEVRAWLLAADKPFNNIAGLIRGNQCDWRILEELRKYDFDIIIDDGSHNSRDQLMTFFGLFNGKHYFIEDLHCCREKFYRQGLPYVMSADYLLGSTLPQASGHISYIKGNNIVLIVDPLNIRECI